MHFKLLPAVFFLAFFVNCQQPSPKNQSEPVTSQEVFPIVGWGDSMMGGSGTDRSLTEYLSDELNRETLNFGVGGITSEAVAILQGGKPFYAHLEGNRLPDKGKTIVTNLGVDPINKQTSSFREVEIEGVPGTLSRKYVNEPPYKTIHYEFERTKNGTIKEVMDTCIVQFKDALENRSNPVIIWAGRNDPKKGNEIYKTRDNIQSMLDYLMPEDGKKKFLILSVCNGSSKKESKGSNPYNEIMALNQLLKESFGEGYIDIRSYLVNDAMRKLGLEPTEDDLKEIKADCIPKSLRSDEVHLNDNGNRAIAIYLAEIIQKRGY